MGFTGIWQWIIILAIVLILFGGRGKISGILGDLGKGLRKFRTGLKEDDADTVGVLEAEDATPAPRKTARKKAARKTKARAKS